MVLSRSTNAIVIQFGAPFKASVVSIALRVALSIEGVGCRPRWQIPLPARADDQIYCVTITLHRGRGL